MTDNIKHGEIATNEPGTKPEQSAFKKIKPKYAWAAIITVVIIALAFQYKNLLIAATVDGHIINRLAVIKKLEKQSGESALNALIEDQLIRAAASKNNITVNESDISGKIATISTQIESAGSSMDQALSSAGMTMDDLKQEVEKQLIVEKLLGDKITVSDEEINKYITDNKVTYTPEQEAQTKDGIREQLKSTKFSNQVSQYLTDLRLGANIKTFVSY